MGESGKSQLPYPQEGSSLQGRQDCKQCANDHKETEQGQLSQRSRIA